MGRLLYSADRLCPLPRHLVEGAWCAIQFLTSALLHAAVALPRVVRFLGGAVDWRGFRHLAARGLHAGRAAAWGCERWMAACISRRASRVRLPWRAWIGGAAICAPFTLRRSSQERAALLPEPAVALLRGRSRPIAVLCGKVSGSPERWRSPWAAGGSASHSDVLRFERLQSMVEMAHIGRLVEVQRVVERARSSEEVR
ncbi:hypothetical protein C8J57DRAFT_345696 [Mycena rebaudengoi]|nr:hypothetical protein C8J57DRAFT_345696 [Mycena rebaudengoi]